MKNSGIMRYGAISIALASSVFISAQAAAAEQWQQVGVRRTV